MAIRLLFCTNIAIYGRLTSKNKFFRGGGGELPQTKAKPAFLGEFSFPLSFELPLVVLRGEGKEDPEFFGGVGVGVLQDGALFFGDRQLLLCNEGKQVFVKVDDPKNEKSPKWDILK